MYQYRRLRIIGWVGWLWREDSGVVGWDLGVIVFDEMECWIGLDLNFESIFRVDWIGLGRLVGWMGLE